MENEDSELWINYREAQRGRRKERLPIRVGEIMELNEMGFEVDQKSPYHFRINKRLDLFPTHNRWHDIERNKRGGAYNLKQFTINFFKNNV